MELEKGTLYLVGTPIGNLDDMTYRAVEVLSQVDLVAAEDTRNSQRLLHHFDIKKPLISYFEHNKAARGEVLLRHLKEGKTIALITDAGMPAISDPGEDIVRQCHEQGIKVSPVPGPSAGISALASSGLPTGRFTFEGFLSTVSKERRQHLESLKNERRTMIFYEAPHKLQRTLEDLCEAFGDRPMAYGRELTKKYEEICRTTLYQAREHFEEVPPKGEFVLVVEGSQESDQPQWTDEKLMELLSQALEEGCTKKQAVKQVMEQTGEKKNRVYDLSLKI
jgi:16S rRNA (cytidine1402-2'-O)-methyltransferase